MLFRSKSPVAPNVPMWFLAQKTEGFSGADLSELCQLAAKAAVRDLIAAEELTKGDPNAMEEDAQPEITRKHFEEAFGLARRSVNAAELNKYDHFRRSFDPVYRAEQSAGGGDVINWPEDDTQFAPAAADDDEDDLYS